MFKLNVCMNFWGVGGAEIFWSRLSRKLFQYQWLFTTQVFPKSDLVFYSNDHKFYIQAKVLNKPIIQRLTGPRSYNLPQPEDLKAVICSSKAGFKISKHPNKCLIYNGIDQEYLKTINPIPNDICYAPARQGQGQKIGIAAEYARKHKRQLTVLGSRQHLAENTAKELRQKYPEVQWPGLVNEEVALGYIKGCADYIMPASVHGVSNSIIEALSFNKNIINLGGVEIPPIEEIDINKTAQKYDALIKSVLNGVS